MLCSAASTSSYCTCARSSCVHVAPVRVHVAPVRVLVAPVRVHVAPVRVLVAPVRVLVAPVTLEYHLLPCWPPLALWSLAHTARTPNLVGEFLHVLVPPHCV